MPLILASLKINFQIREINFYTKKFAQYCSFCQLCRYNENKICYKMKFCMYTAILYQSAKC